MNAIDKDGNVDQGNDVHFTSTILNFVKDALLLIQPRCSLTEHTGNLPVHLERNYFKHWRAPMTHFHHRKLPDYSTLLAGHLPPDEIGFQSDRLQIWYNHTIEAWVDPLPHAHQESDECFIILQGSVLVEVGGERVTIGPHEFCCFPRGVYHQVVEVHPPVETLMIRAPAVSDKVYQPESDQSFSQS